LRIRHLEDLLARHRHAEAIAEAEKHLADNPPPESRGALYKTIGVASDESGDTKAALRYLQLYRAYSPAEQLPALDKQLNRISADLGLPPAY
jgi:hypothetical protein